MSSSDRSIWPRHASQWAAGVFYPLIVAGLLGITSWVITLRQDVAVLQVRMHALERACGATAALQKKEQATDGQ